MGSVRSGLTAAIPAGTRRLHRAADHGRPRCPRPCAPRSTSGARPSPWIRRSLGVNQRAVVMLSTEPSLSSLGTCTKPLPKVVSPTSMAAAGVLHRAGQDLRGAGAAFVDQHHQRNVQCAAAAVGLEDLFAAILEALDDDRAFTDELAGDIHRRAQEAAGIAAQVQHQARGVFASRLSSASCT